MQNTKKPYGTDNTVVKVLLNSNQLLNLEMQVKNEFNWADRSLTYLCRAFDQLQSGQEYEETLPVIHIVFTDFTLFPEEPEFYTTYRMINIKNHSQVYSDKFTLSVVDLTLVFLRPKPGRNYKC